MDGCIRLLVKQQGYNGLDVIPKRPWGWGVFRNLQESDSSNRQDSSDVVYLLQNVAFRNSFHARVIFWEIRKGKAGEYESVPNPVEVN